MKKSRLTNLIPACLITGPFATTLDAPWGYLGSIMLMAGLVWIAAMLNDIVARLDKLEQT